MKPEDAKNADNFIAMSLMAEYGFECTEKIQWGMEQLECDVNGKLLTLKYVNNGTALQFYLVIPKRVYISNKPINWPEYLHNEFFYIATEEQLTYFHDNFMPWILTCLWEEEYLKENEE